MRTVIRGLPLAMSSNNRPMESLLARPSSDALTSAASAPVITDFADFPSAPGLKNQDRIVEIRSRMLARQKVTLRTSFCSRHLRRDFNIASAKMYVYALNRQYREKIVEALSDLHWQIAILGADPSLLTFGSLDVSWLTAGTYDFMMVSAESASMFRALRKVDELVARLHAAERQNLITRDQRRALIAPINLAYVGFKQVAMKLSNKSIEDLLSESNLA